MAHLTTFYKSQQLKCHFFLSSERDINTLKLAIICQIMKENAWIFIKKKIVKVLRSPELKNLLEFMYLPEKSWNLI